MKKFFYLSIIFLGLCMASTSQAQVSVNFNIGSQPLWGPVGYDYARFYYMPEIDVYYNVATRKYTYYHGNRWVTKSKLPGRYKNFNIYRTYKVVMNDRDPWRYHSRNRNSYSRYSNNYSQVVLRDAPRRDHYEKRGRDYGHIKKNNKRFERDHRGHGSHKGKKARH